MAEQLDRTDAAILKVLSEQDGASMGAARIARELCKMGMEISPRTIRFRLGQLDGAGLTVCVSRRAGRRLLAAGREELSRFHVIERLGFVAARVDELAYRMTFDPRAEEREGSVIANVATLKNTDLTRALQIIQPVFAAGLGMGALLAQAEQGRVLAGCGFHRGVWGWRRFAVWW